MICGCCKDIGCYSHNDPIFFPTFGGSNNTGGYILAITDNSPYVFHIWNNGSYQKIEITFSVGDILTLPFNFNENSETTIKIELPSDAQSPANGISFVTSSDGACCFTVHGQLTTCN